VREFGVHTIEPGEELIPDPVEKPFLRKRTRTLEANPSLAMFVFPNDSSFRTHQEIAVGNRKDDFEAFSGVKGAGTTDGHSAFAYIYRGAGQ
jgi:hypothetical protein